MKKFNQSYLIYISNDLQNFQHFDVTRLFALYILLLNGTFLISFEIEQRNGNGYLVEGFLQDKHTAICCEGLV